MNERLTIKELGKEKIFIKSKLYFYNRSNIAADCIESEAASVSVHANRLYQCSCLHGNQGSICFCACKPVIPKPCSWLHGNQGSIWFYACKPVIPMQLISWKPRHHLVLCMKTGYTISADCMESKVASGSMHANRLYQCSLFHEN